MHRQIMILVHSSSPMLLVICDHTFALHGGIAKIVCLEYRMTNYMLHGLSNSRSHLIVIIDHKKMPSKRKLMLRDLRFIMQGQLNL